MVNYINTSEQFCLDILSSVSILGLSKDDFLDDFELADTSKMSKTTFKQKYKVFFDIRKQRSGKSYKNWNSFKGSIKRSYNPKYYSNITQIKDFQFELELASKHTTFDNLKLKYHKFLNKTIAKAPVNFKTKTKYFYKIQEKKIKINGFINNYGNINNWNTYKLFLNYDMNIITNSLRRLKNNEKVMLGIKLYVETYDSKTKTYIPYNNKGIITKILYSRKTMISEIKIKMKDLERIILLMVKSVSYHIYISTIDIRLYTF